jgi:hypothetical protein
MSANFSAEGMQLRLAPANPIGPSALLLCSLLTFSACEAPPDNVVRHWYGDSLRAPAPTSGAAPGAMSEGPTGGGAGGRPASSGAGGSADAGMEEEEEPEEEAPGSGMGGASGGVDARPADVRPAPMTDSGPPPGAVAACQVMVSVTSVTTNRDYAPRNAGVVWVADANGRFVKSVAVWAATRANYLRNWVMATTAAGVARNKTDAVSGATARNHTMPHTGTWNCTDFKGALVPQGKYQLCMEMTEANATGAYRCAPFDHAGTAYQLTLPTHARFSDSRITYAVP